MLGTAISLLRRVKIPYFSTKRWLVTPTSVAHLFRIIHIALPKQTMKPTPSRNSTQLFQSDRAKGSEARRTRARNQSSRMPGTSTLLQIAKS